MKLTTIASGTWQVDKLAFKQVYGFRPAESSYDGDYVISRRALESPIFYLVKHFRLIGIFTVAIILLSNGAVVSCSAQEAAPAQSEATEFQKLEPWLKFLRDRNARDYAITPNGIDEATYVEIGGIEQWITIRGEDRNNPVLLFLHGGPGDATNPWGYAAFRSWLRYFTVVQWDQRGAGRTFGRNGAASASTILPDRMIQDGVELTELLKKRLHKDKIVLVGHSWGSVLGFFMVKSRPDLFYAFVGTGQVAAESARSSAVAYSALLEAASRQANAQALKELKDVGPPPFKDGKGFAVTHKWANRFEGADVFLASALGFALTAPGSSVKDINDWFQGQNVSGEHLVPLFDELDRKLLGAQLAIPVFVIQGAQDYTTPVSLARNYVDSLHAPRKAFVTIEGAGHFAVFTKQDEFLQELRARVLPLIHSRGRSSQSKLSLQGLQARIGSAHSACLDGAVMNWAFGVCVLLHKSPAATSVSSTA